MSLQRVIVFVDGLNLYHAIASLQRQELEWIDLRALSKAFLNSSFEQLSEVFYFSAYAKHTTESALNILSGVFYPQLLQTLLA